MRLSKNVILEESPETLVKGDDEESQGEVVPGYFVPATLGCFASIQHDIPRYPEILHYTHNDNWVLSGQTHTEGFSRSVVSF